jgi:superfamily II DNA or RNA helicase
MTLPLFDSTALMQGKPPKTLRPYQARGLIEVRAKVLLGVLRILCVAPTGAGKTVFLSNIIKSATLPVLVVGHRKEIIDQVARQLADHGITNIGVIRGNDERYNPSASIQVGSIATLTRRDKPFLGQKIIIIVDEAHRCASDTYIALLAAYDDPIVIGFTATPVRLDGRPLGGDLFQELVQLATYSELLKRPDWLVAPDVFAGREKVDVSNVRKSGADFDERQLGDVMHVDRLEGDIVNTWLARAHMHPVFTREGIRVPIKLVEGERRRTLLFAVNVEHSMSLAARFERAGVRVAHLDGNTPEYLREAIFRDLASGELEMVTNCLVAVEGLDIPEVKCITHARPTQSLTVWRQCLDTETEVLTERGFLGVDDIAPTDMVAAFDTRTNEIRWRPILSKVDRPIGQEERILEIRSPSLDLRVTSGHRMVFKQKKFGGEWADWKIDTAANVSEIRSGILIPVAGLQPSIGVDLTDDELRFVGWFLTDGWLDKSTMAIKICQMELQPHINEIDKCLVGCGFKFSKYRRIPKNGFPNGKPQVIYQVSYGKPRGRDKHLRGWGGKLDPFIDKNLSPSLEDVTERQLGVLLEAIHLGDGSKQIDQDWIQRSYHITTGNKVFADRLQSLCVRRGWRCNLSNRNDNKAMTIHIKHSTTRVVVQDLVRSPHHQEERVWCVENDIGTLVIRRRGKTAIVGNCVGREMRPWNNVTPLLLDHAGNFDRLGCPFEDLVWSLKDKPKRHGGQPPMRKCPSCDGYVELSKYTCPHCGADLPREKRALTESPESLQQRSTEPEALKWAFFWRQVVTAKSRGFKPGFASAIYKDHYGTWPPKHWSEKIKNDFATDGLWQDLLARRLQRKAERDEQARREEQAMSEAAARDEPSAEESALAQTIETMDAPADPPVDDGWDAYEGGDVGESPAVDDGVPGESPFADWLNDEGII